MNIHKSQLFWCSPVSWVPWALPWPVSCNGDSRLVLWHLQFLGNLQGIEPSLRTNQLLPVVALEAPAAQAPKISKVRLAKISHYWSPLLITFDHIWSPYQIWQDYGRYGWKWCQRKPASTSQMPNCWGSSYLFDREQERLTMHTHSPAKDMKTY
jgi:hypothetical protein